MTGNHEDLTGVLVHLGEMVFQARDFGLQRTADGAIAIAWVKGYDQAGNSVWVERKIDGATPLGMAQVRLGTNPEGFLIVGLGAESSLSDPTYPCALTHLQSCVSRTCGVNCGDAPDCPCIGGIGGCDKISRDWCDGTCGTGSICNTAVNNCKCEASAPPSGSGTPTTTPADPKPVTPQTLQAKDPGSR